MTKELLDRTAQRVMKRMLLSGKHHYEETVIIREDGGISDEIMELEITIHLNGRSEADYRIRSWHAGEAIPIRGFATLVYEYFADDFYLIDFGRGGAFTWIDEEKAERFSEF